MKAQVSSVFIIRCTGGIHKAISRKLYRQIYKGKKSQNFNKNELTCICLNARSIINKRSDLDYMIADTEPDIIGITESWANKDMVDAELVSGYVMFRKDRQERRGGGVIMYIKDSL